MCTWRGDGYGWISSVRNAGSIGWWKRCRTHAGAAPSVVCVRTTGHWRRNRVGWIGNVFIVIGIWLVGYKDRRCFLFSVVGELAWVVHALRRGQYDLAVICILFGALA